MSVLFLIQAPDGTLTRKASESLKPDDLLVFDGPDSTSSLKAEQEALEAEIAAAGGLEACRQQGPQVE